MNAIVNVHCAVPIQIIDYFNALTAIGYAVWGHPI